MTVVNAYLDRCKKSELPLSCQQNNSRWLLCWSFPIRFPPEFVEDPVGLGR